MVDLSLSPGQGSLIAVAGRGEGGKAHLGSG